KSLLYTTGQRTEPSQVARIDLVTRTPIFVEDKFHQLFTPTGAAQPGPNPVVAAVAKDDKKKEHVPPNVRIAFDGIVDRVTYLTTGLSSDDAAISPDGTSALLTAELGGQENLFLFPLDPDVQNPVARQLTASPGVKALAQWAPDGKSVYYLGDRGTLEHVTLADSKTAPASIAAEFDEDWNRDKIEAFDEAWSAIRDYYADPHTNGVNWEAVRAAYLPRFQGAQNPADLNRLLNLMVGDLDSSHSGAYPPPTGLRPITGRLGLSFDRLAYERDGTLRVSNIVAQSPAAIGGEIAVGDRLLAVDGTAIDGHVSLDRLLNNTIGKKVTLSIGTSSGSHDVALQPTDYASEAHLRYRAWVAANRAYVDKISDGRLGYVHLPDMGEASLDQMYRDLNTQQMAKQGIVIDIRSNEGGFVNAYALDVLSRRAYLQFTSRDQPTVDIREQLGQHALEKPTVLIVNEETLSDGEDFTQGYEAMHLGPVVGEPTAGWIIFTSAIQLIDGTTFRLPSTRVSTEQGQPMELHPRPVDVTVQRQIGSDDDAQLQAAVQTLLQKLR
ncbi:MAG TPA: S41 family peptidase, partial [Candidatus Aquilonibacter sp.]